MDWTTILAAAGIPEPPGRVEAVKAVQDHIAAKRQAEAAELLAKRQAAAAKPPPKKSSRRR